MSKLRVVSQPEIEILDLPLFFLQRFEVNEDIRVLKWAYHDLSTCIHTHVPVKLCCGVSQPKISGSYTMITRFAM